MPLAIVVSAQRRRQRELGECQGLSVVEAHSEVSFVKFRRTNGPRGFGPSCGIPEIVRQFSFGDRMVHEVQGIFGFEEDEVLVQAAAFQRSFANSHSETGWCMR